MSYIIYVALLFRLYEEIRRDLQLRLPQATHSWLNFPFQGNLKIVVVTGSWWILCYFEVTCEFLLNDWLTEINYCQDCNGGKIEAIAKDKS